MRHRIRIQAATTTTDAEGGIVHAFADRLETWARITPMKEVERIEAKRVTGMRSHEIAMRHNDVIKSADRIVYGTRKFDIDGVFNVKELDVETVAICVEVD